MNLRSSRATYPGALRILVALAVALTLVVASSPPLAACTSFRLKNGAGWLMAKSYDWHTRDGLLLVNQRGARKTAFVAGSRRAATWVSRYASLTFNQYGRELPLGGINEAGVAVEVLWLGATQLPSLEANKPTLNELQLIQYLLDTSGTLPELLANLRKVQVQRAYAPVHYFACDASGRCAAIEYLQGALVVNGGATLLAPVLTNNTYSSSLVFLSGYNALGRVPESQSSIDRFVRVSRGVSKKTTGDATTRAFELLASVRTGSYTKWQIVYNLATKEVLFRLPGETRTLRVRLAGRALRCGAPTQAMDLIGTIDPLRPRQWQPWRTELNRRLVRRSFARLRAPITPERLESLITYPSTIHCSTLP